MSNVFINYQKNAQYPHSHDGYSPECRYPEYKFNHISQQKNDVYHMLRECFRQLEYDKENYGTSAWNPLKDFVRPGQYVLLKPNLVLHQNYIEENGIECLITHPSLVRAVIDYVLIALKGDGTIRIGDAPVQSCDFEKLKVNSGYADLIQFYKSHGINIELIDFRNYKSTDKNGILVPRYNTDTNKNIIVNLKNKSAFSDWDDERLKNLRITNYDPRILYEHHNSNVNEYLIASDVLSADVIINMPKPKTHRKAGVTISLKNMVGINTNKEWLPHHTRGGNLQHGDEFSGNSCLSAIGSRLIDCKNIAITEQKYTKARFLHYLGTICQKFSCLNKSSHYSEGSWFGNDTLWRTIYDLNVILMYANKDGTICDDIQRSILIVGDMIISGEKEGPLLPSPKKSGILAVGKNPVSFDEAICSIMGFDFKNIPSVYHARTRKAEYSLVNEDVMVKSNNTSWNNKKPGEINAKTSLRFIPSHGWENKLVNDKDSI